MLTLLEIVSHHCRVVGLPVPAKVVGASQKHPLQMLGLMQELLDDLERRNYWEATIREATFISVASEDQGFLADIADEGFVQFVPDSFYNRTTNLKVTTGLRPDEWQAIKAGPGSAGPFYQVRLRQGKILISPTPPAGETFAFEYHSNYFIEATPYDAGGPTPATYAGTWTADTQKLVGPDSLGRAWLKFAWKREKGLDYAEDMISYEQTLASLFIRDNSPRPIRMDSCNTPRAGVVIPVGSWNVS